MPVYFLLDNLLTFRGGIRQRIINISNDAPGTIDADQTKGATCGRKRASNIKQFLGGMFKTGRISGPELQEGCESSGDKTLQNLAKAGAGGTIRKNVHRDCLSKLTKTSNNPDPYSTKIPLWDHDKNEQMHDDVIFRIFMRR